MSSSWLNIGKVGKAHGLRGAFFVRGRVDAVPMSYGSVVIGDEPSEGSTFKIAASREQNGESILTLHGITAREQLDPLVGKPIWANRDVVSKVAAARGETLWSDLVGRQVVDPSGIALGEVEEIYNVGASDIMIVASTKGKIELPLVADYVDLRFPRAGFVDLKVTVNTFDDLWDNV